MSDAKRCRRRCASSSSGERWRLEADGAAVAAPPLGRVVQLLAVGAVGAQLRHNRSRRPSLRAPLLPAPALHLQVVRPDAVSRTLRSSSRPRAQPEEANSQAAKEGPFLLNKHRHPSRCRQLQRAPRRQDNRRPPPPSPLPRTRHRRPKEEQEAVAPGLHALLLAEVAAEAEVSKRGAGA